MDKYLKQQIESTIYHSLLDDEIHKKQTIGNIKTMSSKDNIYNASVDDKMCLLTDLDNTKSEPFDSTSKKNVLIKMK
jgi:hypothetical protein